MAARDGVAGPASVAVRTTVEPTGATAGLSLRSAELDPDGLLRAAQSGDTVALGRIFVELQPRLLRFLRSQERSAADDLAGEVWLGVAASLAGFTGGWDEFRAWFFTIARRRLIDHRRSAVRRRTDPTDMDAFMSRPSDACTDQQALDKLSGEDAATMIAQFLTVDQAEVVLLRVLGDLDAEQVAQIVGRTANWVRVTQHRALRKLGAHLASRAAAPETEVLGA